MAIIHTLPLSGAPEADDLTAGSIFFVGTATTIITGGGFTLLTDPNFLHAGDHAHLGYGLTSRRLTNPAIEIEALPPLDACLLSHLHGDHWDQVAEAHLPRTLPIITTAHAAKALSAKGFTQTLPLRHWDQVELTRDTAWLKVTALPGKHGAGLMNALLPPVMGSMLEWGDAQAEHSLYRLYISGDTLNGKHLEEIPRVFPDIDLALLHLGGTRVLGILVTMDAAQGIEALQMLSPQVSIPIHYNDYTVFKSSLEDFMRRVQEAGLADRVHYLKHGDTFRFRIR